MADPHELVQQMRQTKSMEDLAEIHRAQAASAERAGRRAWIVSICTTVIAMASLTVAIVALILKS